MRLGIAGFHIESASFLPLVSNKSDFEAAAVRGDALIQAYDATNTVPGGFIAFARQSGAELIPLTYSYLGALGPASDDAVAHFATEIASKAATANLDALLLHLHGASWAPSYPDVERFFLSHIRAEIGAAVPIVLALDYHANIDAATLEHVDACFAYHESPHTDMGETGLRAARCAVAMIETGMRPAVAVSKPGLMVPSIFSATALRPLADIISMARDMERRSSVYLDISILAGFSYADSPNTGFSVVVVGDMAQEAAQDIADALSEEICSRKEAIYRPDAVWTVDDAVTLAKREAGRNGKPWVLLEHADRSNDSSYLLAELVDREAQNVAIPMLWDSEAAEAAHRAGPGAIIDLKIGAWSSPKAGPRRSYRCEVLSSGPKTYKISGEMLTGTHVDLGMTAVVRIGGVTVSLVSAFAFGVDEDAFTVFGQNPRDFDIIVLRSKTHFRQVYEELSEKIVIVDTPDYGPADLFEIPYAQIDKTKVYPFNAPDPNRSQR
ncbi:MAG: M81 family metallopeptidase [Rhodobacteraceae bacterium]|nr:M81 family metallopeptidase [Paracoccaceae bacterium]